MKKSAKAALAAAGAAAAGAAALGCLISYEVTGRNAKALSGLVGNMFGCDSPETVAQRQQEIQNWLTAHHAETLTMRSESGKLLYGTMIPAPEQTNVIVVCCHGYRSTGAYDFLKQTPWLLERGYRVFFMDHTAAGRSEGDFIGMGYYESRDAVRWLHFLNEKYGSDCQIVLYGISMGAATVMMMAGDLNLPDNVRFVIADCGYTSAKEEFSHVLSCAHIPAAPAVELVSVCNRLVAGYDFAQADPIACIRRAEIPMLFIHGSADSFVPYRMMAQLFAACSSVEKETLTIPDAGHARCFVTDPEAYMQKVNSFFDRFLV